jgi:HEAT repeat protein
MQVMAALRPLVGEEPPEAVVSALRDESASIRAMTLMTLGRFTGCLEPLIPSLFLMAESDEPGVRSAAISLLSRVGFTAAAVPELIAATGRPDPRVRAVAADMLARLGPGAQAAIPALIATAREGPGEAVEAEGAFSAPDRMAIQALAKIARDTDSAGPVIAVLAELVRADAPHKWRAAVDSLMEFGPAAESAVPELIRALPKSLANDPKFPDHSLVIKGLGRLAPGTKSAGEAIAALGGLIRTGPSEVSMEVATALGHFGPAAESVIPDLIRLLRKSTDMDAVWIASSASWAIGQIAPGTPSSEEAVEALIGALQSKSQSMRLSAATVLRSFGAGAARAVPHLRALWKAADPGTRRNLEATIEDLLKARDGRK